MVIIFFLDEKIRINLQDFAAVVIINLVVSLFVSLFFVPAMMDKIGMLRTPTPVTGGKRGGQGRLRMAVRFTQAYAWLITHLRRWRWAVTVALVLAFGLPVFLLPTHVEGDGRWASLYNVTLGSDFYREKVKPIADVVLGGTLRLFVEDVYEGSYFTRNDEVTLFVNATLPNGSTLEQMNTLTGRMETFLAGYRQIRQFQTRVFSPYRASIVIYFKREYRHTSFPYTLKSDIVAKALQLGGGSWAVGGLDDVGFNNNVRESNGTFGIEMLGYNYDELYAWAGRLRDKLMEHRRIKEVNINSEYSYWKDDYSEFSFDLDRAFMARYGVSPFELFQSVQPLFGRDLAAGQIFTPDGTENIRLYSRQSGQYDVWDMRHYPQDTSEGRTYKLDELAEVRSGQAPQNIVKVDQQYRLYLQYEYVGSYEMGHRLQESDLEEFSRLLPMGYSARSISNSYSWDDTDYRQYLLLFVVIALIFFITGILFNSLRQPVAILCAIPVSYIGVFLTFYWFKLNFDEGGFASFVLLCGITVNASIYVLNEYNSLRHRSPCLAPLRAYLKAWNAKVVPISLTIISTILGFIPFMVGVEKEAFWFPLAAGTIGGLIMSVVGIFFLLPLFSFSKVDTY